MRWAALWLSVLLVAGCSASASSGERSVAAGVSLSGGQTIAASTPSTPASVSTSPTRQSKPSRTERRADWVERVWRCIKARETRGSTHPWTQENLAGSSASGAFQIIDSTWDNYKGYARAKDAPPAVQVEKFRRLFANGKGKHHWSYPAKQCW